MVIERMAQVTGRHGAVRMHVVYFGGTDWSFRRQPQQYICAEIARRGGRVLFVENTGVRWPSTRDLGRVRDRLVRLLSTAPTGASVEEYGIRAVPALAIPTHPSKPIRALNCWLVRRQLRRAAPELDGRATVSWISLPNWTTLDVTRALRPRLVVYYCGEEFAAVPQAHPSIRESERAVLAEADIVFATSRRLEMLCKQAGRDDTILAPVGVDLQAFADAAAGRLDRPADLRGLRGRVIGYLGGLNHKVDVPLLEAVVRAFPDDSVVILGSVEDPRCAPRPAPNLYVLGERRYEEIAAYLQHFDVCLIPYVRNEFTDSVCPAKLNDYLAAGRSVVSTALAEVLPFRAVIRVGDGHDAFITNVREALEEWNSERSVAARVAAAATRSYDVIVPRMLAAVEARLSVEHAWLREG